MMLFKTSSPGNFAKYVAMIMLLLCPGTVLPSVGYTGNDASNGTIDYGGLKVVRIAMVYALGGVNPRDARVAIDLHWTQHLADVFPGLNSRFELLTDVERVEEKIRGRQLHALSMGIGHYLALKDRVTLTPVFISSRLNQPLESYLLLVQKGMDWQRLGRLSERRLVTEKLAGPYLGRMWLETLLRDAELPKTDVFFQDISSADKPARIVLPVFFGQADACLVPESAYQTMVELNPQISQRLTILERSPGLIKTIHCVTDAMPGHMVNSFLERGMRMDDTVNGRQLLLIFHVKKNFVFNPTHLENSERIFRAYHQYGVKQ